MHTTVLHMLTEFDDTGDTTAGTAIGNYKGKGKVHLNNFKIDYESMNDPIVDAYYNPTPL
jgi:hypothetical protein